MAGNDQPGQNPLGVKSVRNGLLADVCARLTALAPAR